MENIQIINRKGKRQNTHTQTQQPVGQYQVVKYTCNWSPGRRREPVTKTNYLQNNDGKFSISDANNKSTGLRRSGIHTMDKHQPLRGTSQSNC